MSCINLNPLGDPPPSSGSLAAVGLWDRSVRLLRLPSLAEAAREDLGGDVIPRSLLLVTLEGADYLLCAMGDGHLHSFRLDAAAAALSGRKKVSLGTQPLGLSRFASKGSAHVFAASDRPTVIYSNNGKLLFSNVNLKEARAALPPPPPPPAPAPGAPRIARRGPRPPLRGVGALACSGAASTGRGDADTRMMGRGDAGEELAATDPRAVRRGLSGHPPPEGRGVYGSPWAPYRPLQLLTSRITICARLVWIPVGRDQEQTGRRESPGCADAAAELVHAHASGIREG